MDSTISLPLSIEKKMLKVLKNDLWIHWFETVLSLKHTTGFTDLSVAVFASLGGGHLDDLAGSAF